MNPAPDNRLHARTFRTALAALALVLAVAILASCDLGSADSTSAVLANSDGVVFNFAGLYVNPDSEGGPLVFPTGRQSGATLTWLRLLHYGSVIEAFDNANQKWSGRISSVDGTVASFSLRGKTSAGQSVDVVGTMTYANQQSIIDATWIEPSFSGSFFAKATVSLPVTNKPSTQALRVSPVTTSLGPGNTTVRLTASGGSGIYSWTENNPTLGIVSPTTGSTVTYTSKSVTGSNIITVQDSRGNKATATATYSSNSVSGDLEVDPQIRWFVSGGGTTASFTAVGGSAPYSWTVSTPSLGALNSNTGTTVNYTTTRVAGTNVVTLRDAIGTIVYGFAVYR